MPGLKGLVIQVNVMHHQHFPLQMATMMMMHMRRVDIFTVVNWAIGQAAAVAVLCGRSLRARAREVDDIAMREAVQSIVCSCAMP